MDKLAEFLISDRSGPQVAPETLELLGKQAAAAFLERGANPNASVLKIASENPSLTSDHLRRVCEFTNTALYLSHHEKSKTAGASSSYPQFPLADATLVTSTISKKASSEIEPTVDSSYLASPRRSRAAEQREDKERRLDELFAYRPSTEEKLPEWANSKTASADFTAESAYTDLTATKDQLKGIRDSLRAVADEHDLVLKEAGDKYFDVVKNHLLEGGSFADVIQAAKSTEIEDEKIAHALQPLMERILAQKVAAAYTLQADLRGMDKVAHRIVNPEHPFVTLFTTIVDSHDVVEKLASDLRDVEEDLASVNNVIKRNIRALSTR